MKYWRLDSLFRNAVPFRVFIVIGIMEIRVRIRNRIEI